MRKLLALALLLAAVPIRATTTCDAGGAIAVSSVKFEKDRRAAAATIQNGNKAAQLGRYDVSAVILNGVKYSPDLVVLGSMEMVVAPRVLPPELQGKDLGTAVSWGTLHGIPNIKVEVLQDPRGCDSVPVRLFQLDLDELIERHFPDDDTLWPWMIRVRVAVLDSDAKVFARGEGVLKLAPGAVRGIAELSPNKSLERTRER